MTGCDREKVARGRAVVEEYRRTGSLPAMPEAAFDRLVDDLEKTALVPVYEIDKAAKFGTRYGHRVAPSAQEVQLIQDAVDGLSLAAIAAKNHISERGVRRSAERLYWKLGLEGHRSRLTAVAMLTKEGLLTVPDPPIRARARKPALAAKASPAKKATLSEGEKRALASAAAGERVEEQAERDGRSVETIKTQRRFVIRKLGAANMANAVHIAHVRGILH